MKSTYHKRHKLLWSWLVTEPVYYWNTYLLQNILILGTLSPSSRHFLCCKTWWIKNLNLILLLRLCIILKLTCLLQNPVGAGRYDIQKFEEAQHRNGHQSDFKSKTGRLTHAYEKFLRSGYFCYFDKENLLLFLNFCSDLCLKAWFIVQTTPKKTAKTCHIVVSNYWRYSFTDGTRKLS